MGQTILPIKTVEGRGRSKRPAFAFAISIICPIYFIAQVLYSNVALQVFHEKIAYGHEEGA